MVLELRECVRLELMILKHKLRCMIYTLDTKSIRLRIRFIDYCLDHESARWFFWPMLRGYLKLAKWLDDGK